MPQTWNGAHGVRIQAYKGKGDALHPGAEIPVANQAEAYQLAKALVLAFNHLGL